MLANSCISNFNHQKNLTILTYLRYFLGSAILVLTIAGGINFIVDPANIYREGRVTPIRFTEALVHSKHGLYYKEGMFDV